MTVKMYSMTLQESYMLTPNVKHFVLCAKEAPPFHYIAGQFITIHFEKEGKLYKRSYSIANPPLQNNRIEFAAGFVEGGPGSLYLFDLTLGAEVKVSGPFGRLVLKEALPKRYVLVATSTGITPYRAMLPELRRRLQEYPDLQVMILLGVQTHTEILYEQEWMDFARQFPSQVTFRAQLSRMRDVELKLPFFHGYVQTSFEDIKLNPEEDVVYLCGNPGMIDVSFQDLKERGFDTQQVIREKYISNK